MPLLFDTPGVYWEGMNQQEVIYGTGQRVDEV